MSQAEDLARIIGREVVHGRRQLVPQGVLLSQVTSETPAFSCYLCLRVQSTLEGPLALSQRKEGATVGQYALYPSGYTRATKAGIMGCYLERGR